MADKAKMFRVYSVVPRPKQDDYWLNIGSAFPHDDGKGYNVLLQALPIARLPPGSQNQSKRPNAHGISRLLPRARANPWRKR